MSVTHTVQQGECLTSIALDYGYSDWKKIYEHPENEHFRNQRPNPNIVFAGDEITIPEIEIKAEPVEPDIVNVFVAKGTKPYLNLRLVEHIEGDALSNCPYQLTYKHKGKEEKKEGQLDADGQLSIKIPGQIKEADITVTLEQDADKTDFTWKLFIGSPDPVDTPSATAQHLINMGYLEAFTEDRLQEKLNAEFDVLAITVANAWRSFSAVVEDRPKKLEDWGPWLIDTAADITGSTSDFAVKNNTVESNNSNNKTAPVSVKPEAKALLKKTIQ